MKTLRNPLYWRKFERFNSADGVLFTCKEEKRLARTTFSGYAPQQEIVIPYGTSEPPAESEDQRTVFHILCSTLSADGPYLLFLARIHGLPGSGRRFRREPGVVEMGLNLASSVISQNYSPRKIDLPEGIGDVYLSSPITR